MTADEEWDQLLREMDAAIARIKASKSRTSIWVTPEAAKRLRELDADEACRRLQQEWAERG